MTKHKTVPRPECHKDLRIAKGRPDPSARCRFPVKIEIYDEGCQLVEPLRCDLLFGHDGPHQGRIQYDPLGKYAILIWGVEMI